MSELTEAEREAREVRLTEAENGWITNVWSGRGGRLAEAKRDLEAILRDRLAAPIPRDARVAAEPQRAKEKS